MAEQKVNDYKNWQDNKIKSVLEEKYCDIDKISQSVNGIKFVLYV